MRKVSRFIAVAASAVLAACASSVPLGPSVMALPAKGKTMEQFTHDDAMCQAFAAQQVGYTDPGRAATDSGVGTALAATAIGAAAGAAIGSTSANVGAGAAIGAAAGLLVGSVAGSSNARATGGEVQRRYDMRYIQCMSAQGQSVPMPTNEPETIMHYPAPTAGYVYDPGYAYYGPPVGGTVVVRSRPYYYDRYHHRHPRW